MGGALIVAIFALIISQFAFRKAPPNKRAILTAGAAWLACALASALFLPGGFMGGAVGFSIGALIVGIVLRFHYERHWTDEPDY